MTTQVAGVATGPVLLHKAAVASADGNELLVVQGQVNYVAGAFQLSGTLTSVIFNFEATVDGTNWVALQCTNINDATSVATTATAAGIWRFNAIGLYKVRARLAWTSGSATAYGSLIA